MTISFENALGPHAHALSLRAQRTELLANNLANADTPGFKARDIDFSSALARATESARGAGESLRATSSKHVQPVWSGNDGGRFRVPDHPSIDGNTVETHIEQAEFAKNAFQFQAGFQFLSGKFRGLITAIRGE